MKLNKHKSISYNPICGLTRLCWYPRYRFHALKKFLCRVQTCTYNWIIHTNIPLWAEEDFQSSSSSPVNGSSVSFDPGWEFAWIQSSFRRPWWDLFPQSQWKFARPAAVEGLRLLQTNTVAGDCLFSSKREAASWPLTPSVQQQSILTGATEWRDTRCSGYILIRQCSTLHHVKG